MHDVQCRVYMVGGAEATGGPNDTAVVYTPAFHEYDDKGQRRVYVWNVTLPQHFFSRAPVNPDQREQTLTPAARLRQGCVSVCNYNCALCAWCRNGLVNRKGVARVCLSARLYLGCRVWR